MSPPNAALLDPVDPLEPDGTDVDNAVLLRLANDPTLLSLMPNGAYFDIAPEKSTQFVIVSLVDWFADEMLGGRRGFEIYQYAVKAVERTTVPVRNVRAAAARIDALLNPQVAAQVPLTIPNFAFKYMRKVERIRTTEVDDFDRSIRWAHRGGRYAVWVAPRNP